VQEGLRSLMRHARPRKSRGRVSPLFSCVVLGGLLVPAAVGWSAPPSPDPAPPGAQEAEGTALRPDVPPTSRSDRAAPPRSAQPPDATQSAEAPVKTRTVEQPEETRSVEQPMETQSVERPRETPSVEASVQTRSVEAPVETPAAEQLIPSLSSEATAQQPPPVVRRAPRPRPPSARQKPVPASTQRDRPERRRFAALEKHGRWTARNGASRVPTVGAVALVSSDPESRQHTAAAFSLAVLVLGSATLLTVLARLRVTGRRLV
jgi:outer membrane biosynthesis protein TonB